MRPRWCADEEHGKIFKTLREMTAATGHERHGIEVDFDILVNLGPTAAAADPNPIYDAAGLQDTPFPTDHDEQLIYLRDRVFNFIRINRNSAGHSTRNRP